MPANLPPQYYEAERRLREAREPEDKIEVLEEMLAIMPKHKGTDHLKADLRRKIARLQEEAEKRPGFKRASFSIPKEGAAQLVVIGLPNAGKSQLVASTTSASPTVADYPFTTQSATPGMMEFENIQIQLIDTPPLTPTYMEPWLPNMIRRADGLLIVIDLTSPPMEQMETIASQLERKRVRLGGDGVKTLIVANKLDASANENYKALQNHYQGRLPLVAISAKEGTNLEELKRKIYEMLDVIRVYTKAPGQKPDLTDPIVLERGSTLGDAAVEVHKDFGQKLKYARVWGSGKHDGIMVSRDHVLEEGDIIELHI